MKFKVYAGRMYCGMLIVYDKGLYIFKNRNGRLEHPDKLFSYQQLNLTRERPGGWS